MFAIVNKLPLLLRVAVTRPLEVEFDSHTANDPLPPSLQSTLIGTFADSGTRKTAVHNETTDDV